MRYQVRFLSDIPKAVPVGDVGYAQTLGEAIRYIDKHADAAKRAGAHGFEVLDGDQGARPVHLGSFDAQGT